MSNFLIEFPAFPAHEFPALPVSFEDSSWCNDGQPSMTSDALLLHVWCDRADPAERNNEGARYGVHPLALDGSLDADEPLLETEIWTEVLAFIERRRATLTPLEQLSNEWAVFATGRVEAFEGDALEWVFERAFSAPEHERAYVDAFIARWNAAQAAADATGAIS